MLKFNRLYNEPNHTFIKDVCRNGNSRKWLALSPTLKLHYTYNSSVFYYYFYHYYCYGIIYSIESFTSILKSVINMLRNYWIKYVGTSYPLD